ncbi:MAG: TVP38/TMEM64 family protein [Clostridia bacterium]|nr:TVP38/TMEM64 family protein [Clostridia bacterium]MBQ6937373.1 TVP38/TMEM64 family protein [Clostridia bacterium]MBR2884546.1 TVP38/TMEM64 family protein [Clostridia bacterium]
MTKKIINTLALILYAVLIFVIFVSTRDFSIDKLLSYSPESPLLAAFFLFGLYALKSISVVFPIILLQIASGFLFPAPIALLINLTGAVIDFTIPYFLGKFTGADAAEKKIAKNPALTKLFEKQHKHEFFLTFFLRVISCLPADLVSMYLGTLKFKFDRYLIASMLGTLPGLVPATFMGQSITDPLSPEFITALLITIICSVLSFLIYYIYTKKKEN